MVNKKISPIGILRQGVLTSYAVGRASDGAWYAAGVPLSGCLTDGVLGHHCDKQTSPKNGRDLKHRVISISSCGQFRVRFQIWYPNSNWCSA